MEAPGLKQFAQEARRSLIQATAAQLELALKDDSPNARENGKALQQLKEQIEETSKEEVIERAAYTWFNRFCALRFMDVNRYTPVGVISPSQGFTLPEILQDARQGFILDEFTPYLKRNRVFEILTGSSKNGEPQQEAYRMLLTAVCNYYHCFMPFLFQPIRDFTQLLLPADLLSVDSFPARLREVLTPETCQDVEVIGWLYQYYNSEKKEALNEAVKKENLKITAQHLPAATQIFTPNWIVRYLVENTLGRLWMLNRPGSSLKDRMEFYIPPAEPVEDFLRVSSPEELTVCDPACGSGHMLVYAFDILYRIYDEAGYDGRDIPGLILEHNLYGIDVDERAGELAAFALVMKAREKNRRFFDSPFRLNICVLEDIHFDEEKLEEYIDLAGPTLITPEVQTELHQWTEARHFGSLIQPKISNSHALRDVLEEKWNGMNNMFLLETHGKILQVLKQAGYLSTKYHIVITNPPYLGISKMGESLKRFANQYYREYKHDLYTMFIQRNFMLCKSDGQLGFMSPITWMFLPSYQELRQYIIDNKTVTTLTQLSDSGFSGAGVTLSAFTLENTCHPHVKGGYIRLSEFSGVASQDIKTREAIDNPGCGWFYRVSPPLFKQIPGSPFAYWVSNRVGDIFINSDKLSAHADAKGGLCTGNNERFLRQWHEITFDHIGFGYSKDEKVMPMEHKWFPFNKGGANRKWHGNKENVINWANNGKEIKDYAVKKNKGRHWSRYIVNLDFMFKECITWSRIGSNLSVRYSEAGCLFGGAGCILVPKNIELSYFLGLLNSNISQGFISILNPTFNLLTLTINQMPIVFNPKIKKIVRKIAERAINISKNDWNAYETSWDFTTLPLLRADFRRETVEDTYAALAKYWDNQIEELKELEEENNRLFIQTYGLQDELTPDVPMKDISLTCNPHYRFGNHKTPEQLEQLRLTETVKEFISYSVGCMFGRYSLDAPGLILASQGQSYDDYMEKIPGPTFAPDDDNVIPIVEGDWFTDNITQRFFKFLKVTFGDSRYEQNLAFIEKALGKSVEQYFLKSFYTDHVKRYKKRPVYWLFSSPKGSFSALIYLHRYGVGTVSVILNDYLREYRSKLSSRLNHLEDTGSPTSKNERIRYMNEKTMLRKTIKELDDWEQDVLYPLATQNIRLDLDDGVKANYKKFGTALKKIQGL